MVNYYFTDELYHFGVLGMRWGVRKYQGKNGKLTSEGQKHYSNYKKSQSLNNARVKEADKLIKSNKKLNRDFGGTANNIDDWDLFDLSLQELKDQNKTKKYYKALSDSYRFNQKNMDSINEGYKIYKKLIKKKKIK